jgi:excisionase family DNA binding protein
MSGKAAKDRILTSWNFMRQK